jgi:serine/threonine protein kinase
MRDEMPRSPDRPAVPAARTSDAASVRLRRARAIFTCACDFPAGERRAFVADSCGDDEALRAFVMQLLAADEGAGELAWDAGESADVPVQRGPTLPAGCDVVRELGRGGSGLVLLCRERSSGEQVAVKVLDGATAGRSAVARFRREWRLLSSLSHPALVGLRAAGMSEGGTSYLVMDYVAGTDIRRHCRGARVSAPDRLLMLAHVAEALGVVHARGIVHRDVKPANILVGPDGMPKLIDFGAARVSHGDMRSGDGNTVTGQIVGTLAYLSPEQAGGHARRADRRSDLYQLAVVAYELLAGRMPYDLDGLTSAEVLRAIVAAPALGIDEAGAVPAGHAACAFFARALAKDPADRHACAEDMAAELRAVAGAIAPH